MASISNEKLRALAHEALSHLEYVNTHCTVRDGESYEAAFKLSDHIDAIEKFLFRLIGC